MSGYDVSVPAPEELLCASCEHLLREPVQTDTGVHFCFGCLPQEYCADKDPGLQPAAQKSRWHHDMRIKKEVMKLKVKCSNAAYGCKWQGTVRNLGGHLNECHRQVTEVDVSEQIEKLKDFDRRFSESVYGTQRMISAVKDMAAALVQRIPTHQSEVSKSKRSVHGPCATVSQPHPFKDPVANEDLVTLGREQLAVEVQEHPDTPSRSDGSKESMFHDLSEATSVPDPGLELPEDDVEQSFKTGVEEGKAGFSLTGENEKSLEQHELQRAGFTKAMDSLFTTAMSRGGPIVNEKIQRTMVALLDYLENHPSCNGCHGEYIWKISDVAQECKKAQANPHTPLISPPWYTNHGYKLCTHLYLNGNGIGLGSHMSIFLSVMKGDYDRILKWPLKGKMSFCLLDLEQKCRPIVRTRRSNPDSSSFQCPPPQSDMNIASGCPDFAPVTILDDKRYVNDDEMYIKCIMDIA